jgi:ADP-ribosylation factor-binding protein GGA
LLIHHKQGFENQLQPQTGRALSPNQKYGVTQSMQVWHLGDRTRKVESIKLRWRVSYKLGGETKTEMGDVAEFTLA